MGIKECGPPAMRRNDAAKRFNLKAKRGGFRILRLCCYQWRAYVCCCIMAGDMEDGGLGTRMPVLGLTMGMALRVRKAEGWWSFICWLLLDWKPVTGL